MFFLFIFVFLSLFVSLSDCLFVCLFVFLFVCLSVCVSVFLPVCLNCCCMQWFDVTFYLYQCFALEPRGKPSTSLPRGKPRRTLLKIWHDNFKSRFHCVIIICVRMKLYDFNNITSELLASDKQKSWLQCFQILWENTILLFLFVNKIILYDFFNIWSWYFVKSK